MSRRAALERHLASLRDIRDIMNAMKNLSLMETRKLTHVLSTQRAMLDTLDAAVADFLEFFPRAIPSQRNPRAIDLLIGSERGFCGNFNEAVTASYASRTAQKAEAAPFVIVVGSRLAAKLPRDLRPDVVLPGPSTGEEVQPVLLRLMGAIGKAVRGFGPHPPRLTVFAHDAEARAVRSSTLQPFPERAKAPRFAHPPMLNVPPETLASDMARQYLLGYLSALFDGSLLAENQSRLQHMENAIRHLDQETADFLVKKNRLRQEEIIEEIEVLLLNGGLRAGGGADGSQP